MPIGGGHAQFVERVLGGGLADFAAPLRSDGWEEEVRTLRPDQGIASYPPPFTAQGQDLNATHRSVVPLVQLHAFSAEAAASLAAMPPGAPFDARFDA